MGWLDSIGDILGGAGSIWGAISGSNAQSEANDMARRNLAYQQELSKRLLDAQLGTTYDARGNKIWYDEATKTWRTEPSAMTQQLLDASDAEMLAQLTGDAGIRRAGLQQNALQRSAEGQAANSLLDQYMAPSPNTREGIAGVLAQRALSGVNDAYSDIQHGVSTQALRSGTSGSNILAGLAKQRAKDSSNALLDAEAQSYGVYDQAEGNRANRLLTGYNTMAGRASNIDNIQFQPTTLGETLASQQANKASGATGAGQIGAYGVGNAYQNLSNPSQYGSMWPGILAGAGGLVNDLAGLWDTDRKAKGNTTTGPL